MLRNGGFVGFDSSSISECSGEECDIVPEVVEGLS